MPTRTRGNSSVPSRSMIERRPLWPPGPPFQRKRTAKWQVQIVRDHDHIRGRQLVEGSQRADGIAAEVHVRLGLGQEHRSSPSSGALTACIRKSRTSRHSDAPPRQGTENLYYGASRHTRGPDCPGPRAASPARLIQPYRGRRDSPPSVGNVPPPRTISPCATMQAVKRPHSLRTTSPRAVAVDLRIPQCLVDPWRVQLAPGQSSTHSASAYADHEIQLGHAE